MLHIISGRARTGKSERILQKIAKGDLYQKQILIVPEHASHAAETDVCRVCGAKASRYAEVLTFKLLASRVLSIVGGSADFTLDAGGKLLTLHAAMEEVSPLLTVYRRTSERASFLQSILAVMEELQSYAVTPEQLSKTVEQMEGDSGDKLRDLALIYTVYTAHLSGIDRMEKLERGLEASHYIDGKQIYLDGFAYFTGREKNILRIMLLHAKDVTVTLLGDSTDPELFAQTVRVRAELIALAKEVGTTYDEAELTPNSPKTALEHIASQYLSGEKKWEGEDNSVRLYAASSAYAECEYVASEILHLVHQNHYRFRDITVTMHNSEQYAPILETVFRSYGIPLYNSHRSTLTEKPVVTLILGVLDAVSGGFAYEDMFRFLKTGLAGLTPEECDILENYALTWDIRGNLWVQEGDFSAHPRGYAEKWHDDDVAKLVEINQLRRRVSVPLSHLAQSLKGSKSAQASVRALYEYLQEIGLPENLGEETKRLFACGEEQRAEETAQVWGILCDVMDQFVGILQDRELKNEEFAHLFRLILTQYSIGTIPVTLDAVNCSILSRNDRHPVRALFVIGANDGVIPSTAPSGGALKEEDRVALEEHGISLAPHGMAELHLEMQNIYAALAQPKEVLYLSYPTFDAKGTELLPSFLFGWVQSRCPQIKIASESDAPDCRLCARQPALHYAAEHPNGAVWQYFAQKAEYAKTLETMGRAAKYRRGSLSPQGVSALYRDDLHLSATALEKANSCHFAYFMQYGLRAQKRETASFDSTQRGTYWHYVLEKIFKAADAKGGIAALSDAELTKEVKRITDAYIAERLPDLGQKDARFRRLFAATVASAERMVRMVRDEMAVSDFKPLSFELSFGDGENIPSVQISEADRMLSLHGKIDRVDGWESDGKLYLRVNDYKTSHTLDLAKLRNGLDMQMFLYLYALKVGGEAFYQKEIVPSGVLYTVLTQKHLSKARNITQEKLEEELLKNRKHTGMVLDEEKVLEAMEHNVDGRRYYLPVYAKQGSDIPEGLATAEQMGQLGMLAEKQMHRFLREMLSGNIKADPYKKSAESTQTNACTYCEYRQACHFEEGICGEDYHYIGAMNPDEFWAFLEKETGKGAN